MKNNYTRLYVLVITLTIVALVIFELLIKSSRWINVLFAFQIIALVIVGILGWRAEPRRLVWKSLLVGCVAIVLYAFFMQHFGPRVVTEADGPASVRYECMYMGHNPYHNPWALNYCTFLYMPTASGNTIVLLSDGSLGWNGNDVEVYSFLFLEAIIVLSTGYAYLIERRRDKPQGKGLWRRILE